jgi:two-component system, NtrC family, sensor kinase
MVPGQNGAWGRVNMLRSLKTKISFWVGLPLIFIVSISFYLSLKGIHHQFIHSAELRAESLRNVVDQAVIYIMLHSKSRKKGVQTLLRGIKTLSEVELIRMFNKEGIIIKSSSPKEIGKKIPVEMQKVIPRNDSLPNKSESKKSLFLSKNKDLFSLTWPISNHPECYPCHDPGDEIRAFVNIEVSVKPLMAQLSASRNLLLTAGASALFLISAIAFFIHTRFVDRPLKKLIAGMDQIEKGELTTRVQINSTDEFERVSQSFNSMIEKLDLAQKEVEKYHREQMVRADRLASIGELASGIAHEIRNPLIGIGRAVEILARHFQPQDERLEIITQIAKEVERLDKNIKSILMYARPRPIQRVLCNLNEIMDQTLFLTSLNSQFPGLKIERDFAPNLPKVNVDPELIQQVFLNIVLNAIQAMEGEGTIWIKTEGVEQDGDRSVSIKIRDNGKGMTEEVRKNIFNPFYTTRSQGTGLGLSIVQNIIQQHNGSILVQSTPSQGTTFTLILPQNQNPYTA